MIRNLPGKQYESVRLILHAAATATEKRIVFYPVNPCKVSAVWHIPDTILEGTDTDSCNLNLLNVGTAGTGTTEVGHIDFPDTVDTAELDARPFVTGAAATFTAVELAAGAGIAIQFETVASGLLIPPGALVFEYEAM
jgi:hypothetical protein